MTKKQYAAYEAAVEYNLRGLEFVSTGACPGCSECGLETRECPHCDGQKIDVEKPDDGTPDSPCPYCGGTGKIEPTETAIELASESSFSWRACDSCGSSLGGDRHPAHGRDRNGDLVHLSVCTDCLYYLNYGRLDDMAMLEIEA